MADIKKRELNQQWNCRGANIREFPVTPSNTAVQEFDNLYCGNGGDIVYLPRDNEDSVPIVKKNVGNGEYIMTAVRAVLVDDGVGNSTTCTDIIGGWREYDR